MKPEPAPAPQQTSKLPTLFKPSKADPSTSLPPPTDVFDETSSQPGTQTPDEPPRTPPASTRKKLRGPRANLETPSAVSASAKKRMSTLPRPAKTPRPSTVHHLRRSSGGGGGVVFQSLAKTPRVSTLRNVETPRRDSIDVAADEVSSIHSLGTPCNN